jgi:hypothetical protein
MKILLQLARNKKGFALLLVLVFTSIGLLLLTASMNYTSNTALLNERNNQYNSTMLAAEAATEKVVGNMIMDFKIYGQTAIGSKLNTYKQMVPTSAENSYWSSFQFNDAQGNASRTYVGVNGSTYFTADLGSSYSGLGGTRIPYRIISNARMTNGRFNLTNAVQQEVAFTTIPIFQYAIFYNDRLEFTRAAPMNIRGRVHSNGNIYVGVSSSSYINFYEDVSAVGVITIPDTWAGLSASSATGPITYYKAKTTNAVSMELPIGTNNTSEAVHKVIERPPAGEATTSAMGQERYYNKSEVLILVSNGTVNVSIKTPFATVTNQIPASHALTFISTNKTMYDQREDRTQLLTEIDIGKLTTWMGTNTVVNSTLGTTPSLIYIDDTRGGIVTTTTSNIYITNYYGLSSPPSPAPAIISITTNTSGWTPSSGGVYASSIPSDAVDSQYVSGSGSKKKYQYKTVAYDYSKRVTNIVTTTTDYGNSAVRLVNGQTLPANGLTVSTPNGLYIKGDFNCPTSAYLGTTNTSTSKPASLVADAVTILSSSWSDTASSGSYSSRVAANTTINAAIVSGNVPSGGAAGDDPMSGGAHNLPRFLEAWSGKTCTINGSLVCLYQSTKANAHFTTTGQTDSYYSAPNRNWSFDKNFLDPNKLPPGTPAVRVLERLKWTTPPPNTTTYAGY